MTAEDVEITGSVDLVVDPQGTRARIVIALQAEGAPWSAESIIVLLKRKRIVNPPDIDTVRGRLKSVLEKGAARVAFLVAEGIAPSEGTAEHAEFEHASVPAGLAAEAGRVLAKAENPVIVVNRTHKVRREQLRRRKPILPFLRPKEKRVTVTETESVPERIYVDPTVERTAFVEAETRIGRVSPQKPGTPGVNVYGAVIPPKPVADPLFYCGNGIRRRGDELTATVTGFLRIGANWADVVEYAPHRWDVGVSEDRASCFVDLTPGNTDAPPPVIAELLQRARELGFDGDQLLPARKIEKAVSKTVKSGAHQRIPISADSDASFEVLLSDDRLTARLNLVKGGGRGRTLVLREVGQAIRAAGLARLDRQRIQADIVAFYRSSDVELTGYVLAEGTAPVPGPPREAEFSLRPLPEPQRLELFQRASADPRALAGVDSVDEFPLAAISEMALVESEQRIVTIPPPVAGSPGIDVCGKVIKLADSPEPPLRLFENLTRTGNVIISRIGGVLDRADIDGVTYLRVRPHRDAEISVTVTADRMQAHLSLRDGAGSGQRIDEPAVRESLEHNGVRYGIKDEVLRAAVAAAIEGQEITHLLIAEGEAAVHPSADRFQLLVEPVDHAPVTIRSDGSADFKNQRRNRTVGAGTALARIMPQPAQPQPGADVSGAEIAAAEDPFRAPEIGAFVRREEQADGSVLLVAEREGDFRYDGNRLEIRVEHTIDGSVDLSTGNIRFPGSISVNGSVGSGFFVLAAGDVTVAETVEAALVSADGDIAVRQGVKGAGRGVLRARGTIAAGFAEQATLLSIGDITLNSGALHCTVRTNGRVLVTRERGAVVGGSLRARHGLLTPNLGSPNGMRTAVSFGQDYLIADKIEKEEKEIDAMGRRVAAVETNMSSNGHSAEQIEALRREKKGLLKAIGKRRLRLFTLRERFESHHNGTVAVRGTVHPGVTLESHGRTLDIGSPRTAVRFIFDESAGRIVEQPLGESGARSGQV